MKLTIAEVELFVIVYAWPNKGSSVFVSTCGKIIRHADNYISNYWDEYRNVCSKEIARPAIAHMLYKFLPSINEHNKSR